MSFQKITLQKCSVLLTQAELNSLLLKDVELFKLGLARSKAFQRTDSKREHYEKMWATHEEKQLKNYLQ